MSTPNPGGCYAVAVVLLVASTTVVSLRLNVRRVKKTSLGLDDLFISIALVRFTSQWRLCRRGWLLTGCRTVTLVGFGYHSHHRSIIPPFRCCYHITDSFLGTARGTVGTHTRQDPVTRLIQVTWHENDIAMVRTLSGGMIDPSLTGIDCIHFPNDLNRHLRCFEAERSVFIPTNLCRQSIQSRIDCGHCRRGGVGSIVLFRDSFSMRKQSCLALGQSQGGCPALQHLQVHPARSCHVRRRY